MHKAWYLCQIVSIISISKYLLYQSLHADPCRLQWGNNLSYKSLGYHVPHRVLIILMKNTVPAVCCGNLGKWGGSFHLLPCPYYTEYLQFQNSEGSQADVLIFSSTHDQTLDFKSEKKQPQSLGKQTPLTLVEWTLWYIDLPMKYTVHSADIIRHICQGN